MGEAFEGEPVVQQATGGTGLDSGMSEGGAIWASCRRG